MPPPHRCVAEPQARAGSFRFNAKLRLSGGNGKTRRAYGASRRTTGRNVLKKNVCPDAFAQKTITLHDKGKKGNDMKVSYKETDKMFDVISDEYHLLQMMSRFGIPLGFGEKTVSEVCRAHGVDTQTFLAVANYLKLGPEVSAYYVERLSVEALMGYLCRAHSYFLDFYLPGIRRRLVGAIDCSQANEVAYLILKFYDEYMGDVRRHMEMENHKVFPYVDSLLGHGTKPHPQATTLTRIAQFSRSHVGIDRKLQELKNLIIKYYGAADSTTMLNTVLFDIFTCEEDLRQHCAVEDDLFVPAVERLEQQAADRKPDETDAQAAPQQQDALSEREKEIVGCIVRGLTNKETADRLFISVNTVLTHRKNIFRKLDIHSVSGLTIYAIVNGLVKLDEVKL